MSSSGLSAGEIWQVILFLMLPLLTCYVGLLVWSCNRDRWKR
jgi:hypothetical protein